MKKKIIIISILILIVFLMAFLLLHNRKKKEATVETHELNASILTIQEDSVTVKDDQQVIYTFPIKELKASVGDTIVIRYTGLLDKDKEYQVNDIIDYETVQIEEDLIPSEWLEEGIFHDYYEQAYQKLKTMSLNEKIGQLLLVRYKEDSAINDLKNYHFGGFVFFEKDFKNKTSHDVKTMIYNLQKNATIPLLTAVDEEGGKVVRISSNPNLVHERFKSSKELYSEGGFPKIKEDTKEKSKVLYDLGINLNLAPVVDVSTDPKDYMYERAFGHDTTLTKAYAKTVIEASIGTGVSYTLKHFPGYGNNTDTHTGSSVDNRTYESILTNDIPPFLEGIIAGAEAVLVSHNIVSSIDDVNPASLSPSIHNILRNRLEFSGIIISDDLYMGATANIQNATLNALLAGNDLIITTDYDTSVAELKKALENDTISEDLINRVSLRVLAWKYYKGLFVDNEK